MARKAVQGYTEKNYYDNTRYRGVVSSNDPLNEGFFRHMVNLEISDTGQSLVPRMGYLTTTLKHEDEIITLSANTIIFRDSNTQLFVVFDLQQKLVAEEPLAAYLVDLSLYNIVAKFIPVTKKITAFDYIDVLTFLTKYVNINDITSAEENSNDSTTSLQDVPLSDVLTFLTLYTYQHVPVQDINLIQQHLFKIKYANITTVLPFWLTAYYRDEARVGNGTIETPEFPKETLILSVLNTQEQPAVDSNLRNLASSASLIPEVFQIIYSLGETPAGFVNDFPIIYIKDNKTNKYLTGINYNKPIDLTLIPRFALEDFIDANGNGDVNSSWAYAYDIINMRKVNLFNENRKETVYRSAPFNLKTNERICVEYKAYYTYHENSIDFTKINNVPVITVIPATLTRSGVIPDGGSSEIDNNNNDGRIFRNLNDHITGTAITQDDIKNALTALKNLFVYEGSVVSSKADLLTCLTRSAFAEFKFYLHTFSEYDKTFTVPQGSMFAEDTFKDTAFITSLNRYSTGGDAITRPYAENAVTVTQLIEFIKSSDSTEFVFRLFPMAFKFFYQTLLPPTNIVVPTELESYFQSTDMCYNDGVYNITYYLYITDLAYTNDGLTTAVSNVIFLSFDTAENKDASIFNYAAVGDTSSLCSVVNETALDAPDLSPSEKVINKLLTAGYMYEGLNLVFYLFPTEAQTGYIPYTVFRDKYIASSALNTQIFLIPTSKAPSTILEKLTKEPYEIQHATAYIVFNSLEGHRLVTWFNNQVYVSEPGEFFYFKEAMRWQFNERVVKVIQFKTILLVFTVQHLYAIYPVETTSQVNDSNSESGRSTVTTVVYYTTPVLYNILTSDKYKDAIQVFNQMVLFYSADGQMYMIKPSTTIDSDTRFSLQYFNKSANDILLNYTDYINERLKVYGIDRTVTENDVKIKVLISINFIKTFYTVDNLITYILVYDVLNNYYYVLDTLTFSNILNLMYIEGGEVYTTTHNDRLYITLPFTENNAVDNNVDTTFVDNFSRQPIRAEIDTGILNLNNHLTKRFRDLYVTYKNINATELEFALETFLDDVLVQTYLDTALEVKDIGGQATLVPVTTQNTVKLFNNEHALFDFSGYQSNKLLTHRGQILGIGKSFRMKMQFISKGNYKIQSFGIIYKERRV